MSFVAAGTAVAGWATATGAAVGLTGTAALIGGGAILGAGVGGAYSALTGDGNILDSMLTGAGIGGLGGWGLSAAGLGTAATAAPTTLTGAGALTSTPAGQAALASNTPAVAAYGNTAALDASSKALASGSNLVPAGASNSFGLGATGATNTGLNGIYAGTTPSGLGAAGTGLTASQMLGYGLGATTLMGLLGGQQQEGIATQGTKGMIRPYEYNTDERAPEGGKPYYFEPIQYDKYGKATKPLDTSERNYFTQNFKELPAYAAANGGQVPPNLNRMPAGGLAALQSMRDGYGATQTVDGNIPQFSMGGHLGGYSDGGQLLKGPGDGVSDSIPASINEKQPARLADGEFVIPARIVSELGNGSTDAGAKRLYGMMDRIQADRSKTTGKGNVAVDSKARKHLPA